jgi:hypothetical protein
MINRSGMCVRRLLDTRTLIGLRALALTAVITYTFARVNAALQMMVRDYFVQGHRSWVALLRKAARSTR